MRKVRIKDLRRGQRFLLYPVDSPDESQVYIRGKYWRKLRRYECCNFVDIFYKFFKGDTLVYYDCKLKLLKF